MTLPRRLLALAFTLSLTYIVSAQYNVRIVAGGSATGISTTSPFDPFADDAELGVDLIITALQSGDAIINTNTGGAQAGTITIDADISVQAPTADANLILNAEGDITLNNNIFNFDAFDIFNVQLNALNGNVNASANNILTGGGSLNITAGIIDVNVLNSSSSSSAGGNITVNAGTDLVINNQVRADGGGSGGGIIDLTSAGNLGSGAATLTISSTDQASGDINLNITGSIVPDLDLDVSSGVGGGSISIMTSDTAPTNIANLSTAGGSGSGNVTISVGGTLDIQTPINISTASGNGGTLDVFASDGILINGAINTSGDTNGGNVTLDSDTGPITVLGAITVDGLSQGGIVSISNNITGNVNVGAISSTSNGTGGDVLINTQSSDATVTSITTTSSFSNGGNAILDIGGTLSVGAVDLSGNTNGGTFTVTANEVDLTGGAGSILSSGSGILSIAPRDTSLPLVIGGVIDGGGQLDLTVNDLSAIEQASFSQIVVGSVTGTGDVTLANSLVLLTSVTIQSGTSGAFDADGVNLYSIDGGGSPLVLNFGGDVQFANIINNGGDVNLIGENVTAYPSTSVNMVASGGAPFNAGTFIINANAAITTNTIDIGNLTPSGTSGNISLFASGDITINGNFNLDNSSGAGVSGSVNLTSDSGNIFSVNGISSSSSADAGGSVTMNATTGNVTYGFIALTGSTGSGGISITANDQITTGNLTTEGGTINLNAPGNSGIFTSDITSTSVGAGDITMNTAGSVSTGLITASGAQSGGVINISSLNMTVSGGINVSGGATSAGSVSLSADNLTLNGDITADSDFGGGDITINSFNTFETFGSPFAFSSQATVSGQGGTIIVNASTIGNSFGANASGVDAGGSVTLDFANSGVDISSFSATGTGGVLDISTNGDIIINNDLNMQAPSFGAGGSVTMDAQNGAIQFLGGTGILTFGADEGGTTNLSSSGNILVGAVEANYANSAGVPGSVTMTSFAGSIEFSHINTESTSEIGGFVRLSAFTNVVGSGSFLASNSETVSISTIGPVASGSVLISHNADNPTDFEIGLGSTPANGLFASLAADASVASDNFLDNTDSPIVGGDYTSGDLRVTIVSPDLQGELLSNGDFETGGESPWFGNAANVIDDGGNFVNFADVTSAGNSFDVNISQVVDITQGQTYNLTFDAFSDVDRSIDVGIGLNEFPFTATVQTINLTTTNQTFSVDLVATDFGIPNSRVIFDIGAEIGAVTLDNVSLKLGATAVDNPTLSGISVDGVPIDGFTGANQLYLSTYPNGTSIVPTVTATTANPNATTIITDAVALPGTTLIDVTAEDGFTQLGYAVNFAEEASLPFDFENSSYPGIGFLGAQFSLAQDPEDAANQVGQITNSGSLSEGVTFQLLDPVDLVTGNELSLRYYTPQTNVPLTLRLENDEFDFVDQTFFPGNTGWNTFTFNFGSNIGSYANLTLFIDLNGSSADTYFVDDIVQNAFQPVLEADSLALVNFYQRTGGATWFGQANWLTGPVGSWQGISVNNGRVTIIELSNNNLSGFLPDSLNLLTELEVLGVARNNISGNLPSDLSALTNLRELKIGRNNFNGTLPDYISTFSQLNRFGMSNNDFSGAIPASYSNLSSLNNWNIEANRITGLPDLRNLNFLSQFKVSFNRIPDADIDLNASVITENVGQIGVFSNITTDTTWSGLVIMQGPIYVEPGATLTINPGTIVKATEFPDLTYLVVARGANINAIGTPASPIIFTTVQDDIELGRRTGDNLNEFDRFFWGGVIVLGNAQIGAQSPITGMDTVQLPIDGISDPTLGTYGGLDDTDNSGTLSYVSIRHGGIDIGVGNPLNGLTLAGVGSGTTVDHIEVFASGEDGIEFFGGAVSPTNIVVNNVGDDALNTDRDYIGTVSNFAIVDPSGSGLELDGPENMSLTSRAGMHLFTDGSISAGPNIQSIVDWDLETNGEVQNFYITGLASGYATINGNNVIESFNGNGGASSNWEISPVDGLSPEDVLGTEAAAITTEVIAGSNTTGVNPAGFDWTLSALRGFLVDFGLAPPPVPLSDSTALVALYNATDGPNWSNNSNWLTGPVESWYGVKVVEGRVYEVSLFESNQGFFDGNNLNGTIPAEIGDLAELRVLDLGLNTITGSIPSEIGNLTNLEFFNVPNNNGNGLTGSLPVELGNLSNLIQIELIGNQLSGSIPPEFGNLTSLVTLGLSQNQLSGDIPITLGNLSNLKTLNLSSNQLTGVIPDELGNLLNVEVLYLSQNQLTGTIPATFSALDNLLDLQLWANQLSGTIPPVVGEMAALSNLDLNGNQFDGSIPPEIGNASNLRNLSFPANLLTGDIPPEIGNLANLNTIWLDNNQLTGSIPVEFDNLTNLISIGIARNNLSGAIPNLTNVTLLNELRLGQNQLSGDIPDFIGNNLNLSRLGLSNNAFTGAVPANFNQLTNLDRFNIRSNQLEDLPDLSNLTQLTFFDVSFNRFGSDDLAPNLGVITQNDGQIGPVTMADSLALIDIYNLLDGPNWSGGPTWLTDTLVALWEGVTVSDGRVVGLDLNSFGISGALPAEIAALDALETLGLANNQLTSLPPEIGNLSSLTRLFIDNNQISGPLPPEIGNLTNLEEIFAQMNNFTGPIPTEFSTLTNLRWLWLANNQLTGNIPTFLGGLTSLNSLNLSGNNLDGQVPAELNLLVNLTEILIEDNAISGSIPDLMNTAVENNFNISGNRFSMENLLEQSFDQATPVENYDDQEFVYTVNASSLTPGTGPVSLTVTNSVAVDNEFQWYKDGQPIPGVTTSSISLAAPTLEDNGIYTCLITNPSLPGVSFRSESHSLDINEVQRNYGVSVSDFSYEESTVLRAASEAIGVPNSILDATPQGNTRAWKHTSSNIRESITLDFGTPAPINTIWIYGDANTFIDSVLVRNASTLAFESILSGGTASIDDPNGLGVAEAELNFATTSFNVSEVKLVVRTQAQIDAVAVGDNGLQINVPQNLTFQIVTDTIFNIGWSHVGPDSTNYSLERSLDGTAFAEVALVEDGFTRYSDRDVPSADTIYYRVKAIEGSVESPFSEVLVVPNCGGAVTANIPEGSWTGTAEELSPGFDPDGGFDPNVSFSRNADGTITINDFNAGYLDNNNATPVDGILSEACNGSLEVQATLSLACGGGGITSVNYVEFFPASDSLVIEYTFNCGYDIRLTYVKNATEPPANPPVNLEASIANSSTVRLTWQDVSSFEDEWVIERSVGDNTNFLEIDTSTPNPQLELSSLGAEFETYFDNTVIPGTTYFYRIRTRNGGGDSEPSDEVSILAISPLFEELTAGPIVGDQPTNSYSGAWGDYDGDNDLDLYVTNWHFNFDPVQVTKDNYLYQNNAGNFSRVSVTGELTDLEYTSRGAIWADYNNDGNLDVFVLGSGPSSFVNDGANSYLFIGDGSGNFTTNPNFPSLGGVTFTASDLNADGNLDLILNDGDFIRAGLGNGDFASFGEVSGGASVDGPNGFAGFWTALTPNINNDSLPDLFFANGNAVELYENKGNFNFELLYRRETGDDFDQVARGSVFGDFDHNGYLDILIANRETSTLLLFDETGIMAERADIDFLGEELFAQRGMTVLDFDNDGNEDLAWILDDGQPTLFRGNGDATFTRVGSSEQLFPKTSVFSSLSIADYNDDGFQDIFLAETDPSKSNTLFTNAGGPNNHLRVNLTGTSSNRLGVDAQVRIKYEGNWRMKQVTTVNGLWSSNEITTHFGVGTAAIIDSVEVKWPSGEKSFLTDVSVNQTLEVLELAIPVVEIDSIVTNAFQPEITGRVSDFTAFIEVLLEGNTYNAINNADSTWFLPAGIVDSLFNGEYELIARATNAAGVGTDTTTLVIDQKVPVVTIDTLVTNQRSPELTGTVTDVNGVVAVEIDKETYFATVNMDSTWVLASGRIDPPLEDGVYDVIATGSNIFGDSTDITTNELRLDGTAPTIFVDNIGTSITSPELTGFIDDFTASFVVNVEGRGDFVPDVNPADSSWSIAQGTIVPGFTEAENPILIVATAIDSLSNTRIDSGELIISNTIIALEPSRITTNSFRANWSSVPDAINYNLEIALDETFTTIVASVDTLSTSFDFEDAEFETAYFYRVTFDNGVPQDVRTSNTVTLQIPILPETVADFAALLEIKQATNATTNWDAALRKQNWELIDLVDERVAGIDLSNNTLESTFPLTRDLTALTLLDISGNALTGIDSLAKLRSIETLNVSDNLFDFGDLEPLQNIETLTYSPQRTRLTFNEFLDSAEGGSGEKGDADSLKILVFENTGLSLTSTGVYDRYEWLREGQQLSSGNGFDISDSTLSITSIDFDKMGKFSARVVNDSLPELTIPVDSMFVLAIAPFRVNVLGTDGTAIPDPVDGYLLLTEQRGAGFDTLSNALGQLSPFTIDSVILGDYLVSVDSDREKYIPTYFSDAFEWIEADTIQFRNNDTVSVNITVIPPPPSEEDPGVLNVVIEEDFGDDNARVDARRRAKKRKCGLRRRVTGGRTEQDGFELFAYGETDDNGEFQFGFLPAGEYRFFVEYPGIPIDESSFVEFTVGELGISDTEFSLSAFATEGGVAVEIQRILGVIFDYFKDLRVYPNPASEQVKIEYRHLKAQNVVARMLDLSGNELWTKDIRQGYDGYEEIDVSEYEEGIYVLQIFDKESRNSNVVSYRIIVRK